MSNATELLRRALEDWDSYFPSDDCFQIYEDIRAFLAAEPEASALQRYKDCCKEGEPETPIERLRFFCSLAMKGQDWLDVEHFFDFLDAEPEAEPVAWRIMPPPNLKITDGSWLFYDDREVVENLSNQGWKIEPLYTRPEPARKPMAEEEIDIGFNPYRMRWLADDQYFVAGVRWAEKHHGIDGNQSEIISNQEVDKLEEP